jgi:hypothetical protein
MNVFKKAILLFLVVLIIIQFFHPYKNKSTEKSPYNIASLYAVPQDVDTIMKKACNDCHSNNTRYPWYSNIQPVAWWMDNHVRDGKKDLNFDDFSNYRISRQYRRMQDIIDLVKKGEMPLTSYTLIHSDAKLSVTEKEAIYKWAGAIRDTMKAKYPPDSLKRKR